ncbi:tetratricopeptide repeat protein [Acidithiobacillus ferriphilus]|uniref:tetratricopeptide repeat protein n=1 Tax=Acidithiobacillus ferriphilus TaxID=1689834 RepID=UPI001C0767B6|nr:tetratricopeptide repeat protein [Acidithiobacillus ferriphilus]
MTTAPDNSSLLISTQTAALLTGKTIRTINNWLESGAIKGHSIPASHLPHGQIWQIDISSMVEHIPTELTDEFLKSVKKAEAGDAQETTNVGLCLYKSGAEKISISWFELAAKRGNADAMEWLWHSYYHGKGVETNYAIAVQWLGKSAEHGSVIAKSTLENLRKIDFMLREQQQGEMDVIRKDIERIIKPTE